MRHRSVSRIDPEEIATQIIESIDNGEVYDDGTVLDRAFVIRTLKRAAGKPASFGKLVVELIREREPDLDRAQVKELVAKREQIASALLRRISN